MIFYTKEKAEIQGLDIMCFWWPREGSNCQRLLHQNEKRYSLLDFSSYNSLGYKNHK